jgi:hypothetical protein
MKIVINSCYGGFGLSNLACKRLIELGYIGLTEYKEERLGMNEIGYFGVSDIERTDSLLIQVVEELGEKVNDRFSKLKIIEIPDDVKYRIEEYDGVEWIAEDCREWR